MGLLRAFWPHFAVIASGVTLASPGHAQGAALHLVVRGGLPAEAIRVALAQDTHRQVVLDDDATPSPERVTIALRAEGEVAVTFDAPGGNTTTRIIHATGDAVIGDAALLAASLTVGIDVWWRSRRLLLRPLSWKKSRRRRSRSRLLRRSSRSSYRRRRSNATSSAHAR